MLAYVACVVALQEEATDRPICSMEPLEPPLRPLLLLRIITSSFQVLLKRHIPESLMLITEQQHYPRSLRVEAAGNMEHSILCELLDFGVRDWRVGIECVDAAAEFDGIKEGHLGKSLRGWWDGFGSGRHGCAEGWVAEVEEAVSAGTA